VPQPKPKDRKDKKDQPEKVDVKTVEKIKIDTKSDAFSSEERKELLKIIKDDVEHGEKVQAQYIAQKIKDEQHYHSEKPSKIEGLSKLKWMSDRNLGLARAIADIFQAVFLATCWNPDSINYVATKKTDVNNRENQIKFTKWGMGAHEANAKPEVDDFIHNRIVAGGSFFKIFRKVWDEWVDRRIPKKNKDGNTYAYEIKTEKKTFQKGVIENISNIDDILMPEYGRNIQELPFFIHVLHLDGETVLGYLDKKRFIPENVAEYKKKLKNHAYSEKESQLGAERMKQLKLTADTMDDVDIRRLRIDLHEWYGYFTKDGKTEKFRICVDLVNDEFLAGKPVRKINRSGKIPFAGGSLCKEPGQIRGDSLMKIIAPIINAFNNVFNQKSDFQYVTNCPIGFHNPDEGYSKQVYELEPMKSYPVSGDPSRSVYFPNLSRSMAWAESDMRILFEVLERLTGAASYFLTTQTKKGTLGRDIMVEEKGETKFGLWVSRIQENICEAISMWFELYQDFPPKNLAERILGADGKQLFRNLSIDTLRGDSSVQMTPDTTSGSKAYRRQLQMMLFQIGQNMVWLHPQVNPKGNWNWCADMLKEIANWTDSDVRRYLGEEPKAPFDEAELETEWTRFMNGEDFEPPEGETALSLQHLTGHTKQKAEKYDQLDEEYRANFDSHLFKTTVNFQKFLRNAQRDMIANQMATSEIMGREQAGMGAPPQRPAPAPATAPPVTPPAPGGMG